MALAAILFDLDGTLADTVPAILAANREVAAAMGLPYDEALVQSLVGIPLAEQAAIIAKGREADYIERYRESYRRWERETLRLFPGTVEMLDEVRSQGYLTALVTSKGTRGARRVIETMGMAGRFDAVVTADDVQNAKPHPEPILRAVRRLRVTPDQALFVGDSFFDVDSARAAGVAMAGVSWGARTRAELSPLCPVFDSWDEFVKWLQRGEERGMRYEV